MKPWEPLGERYWVVGVGHRLLPFSGKILLPVSIMIMYISYLSVSVLLGCLDRPSIYALPPTHDPAHSSTSCNIRRLPVSMGGLPLGLPVSKIPVLCISRSRGIPIKVLTRWKRLELQG
jgi:hypothetical protein